MALNMPRLDLADRGRRVPITEEACEQKCCPCWREGFAAGARAERERRHARTQADGPLPGVPLLVQVLGALVLVALLAVWVAKP